MICKWIFEKLFELIFALLSILLQIFKSFVKQKLLMIILFMDAPFSISLIAHRNKQSHTVDTSSWIPKALERVYIMKKFLLGLNLVKLSNKIDFSLKMWLKWCIILWCGNTIFSSDIENGTLSQYRWPIKVLAHDQ